MAEREYNKRGLNKLCLAIVEQAVRDSSIEDTRIANEAKRWISEIGRDWIETFLVRSDTSWTKRQKGWAIDKPNNG